MPGRRRRLATWMAAAIVFALGFVGLAPNATASGDDLTSANSSIAAAIQSVQHSDLAEARRHYEAFRNQWLDIEDGIKDQSRTAYKAIEDEMATVQFALLQNPPDPARVEEALKALQSANEKFVSGGYPADGAHGAGDQPAAGVATLAQVLQLLDKAESGIRSRDAAGALEAMTQFRNAWLDVEGVVLTQSAKVYGDSERDMVEVQVLLQSNPPDFDGALAVVSNMKDYLAPVAGKTSYSLFDATTIILREGLEAMLVVVALLGFLRKSGQPAKSIWVWGGVTAGLVVSTLLAVAVRVVVGSGAFGNNNFLIAGWTGVFAAVMLVYVSYWLHSKANLAEWNRYIREKSTLALATGNLLSLATLAFLAVFREGTETVLFYIGMASSITLRDLVSGLALGFGVLIVLAVAMIKIGLKIPMRPFFLVSSILVFYLGFKFTGMGVHGLQLAGVLPATRIPYLPSIDFLALYPNWQSALPQLFLLILALAIVIHGQRRGNNPTPAHTTDHLSEGA